VIGPGQRAAPHTNTVLVHTPCSSATGGWESHLWEVVMIPKVGEHVVHAGELFRVELVIHPLYEHDGVQQVAEYTAELCCVPVSKQHVLAALTQQSTS
jgi:hypothetical protein